MHTLSESLIISPRLYDSHNDTVLINHFDKFTERFKTEGRIEYLYSDTKAVVTIGKGLALHTLEDALKLPLYIKDRTASPAEVTKIYHAVQAEGKRQFAMTGGNRQGMPKAEYYEDFNKGLYMTKADIDVIYAKSVRAHLRELKTAFFKLSGCSYSNPRFRTLYEYPVPAQLALLDMAFNMGTGGLLGRSFIGAGGHPGKLGFPTMLRLIRENNFRGAAKQCRRSDVSEERNAAVANLFEASHAMYDRTSSFLDYE